MRWKWRDKNLRTYKSFPTSLAWLQPEISVTASSVDLFFRRQIKTKSIKMQKLFKVLPLLNRCFITECTCWDKIQFFNNVPQSCLNIAEFQYYGAAQWYLWSLIIWECSWEVVGGNTVKNRSVLNVFSWKKDCKVYNGLPPQKHT